MPEIETKQTPQSGLSRIIKEAVNAPILVPLLAILTALVVGGVIIALVGGNPFAAYIGLAQGAFGSFKALSETAVWASPYIFAGLAVALAFKGGLFNIGAEGQLAFGAVAAAWFGYALPDMLGFAFACNPSYSSCCWHGDPRRHPMGCHPWRAQSLHGRA